MSLCFIYKINFYFSKAVKSNLLDNKNKSVNIVKFVR